MILDQQQLNEEFDRQVANLVAKGYPELANLSEEELINEIAPLKEKLIGLSLPAVDLELGKLPFVIVVNNELISPELMMEKAEKNGKSGVTILRPHTSKKFHPINEVAIPKVYAYLLLDIDRGKESLNLPPNEAIKLIKNEGRSPLTISEGIAIVTQFPELLIKNNCFSLLASRTGKDQRVPAIWINAKKEPNLGWCWDGNPHTWLGSASSNGRIA